MSRENIAHYSHTLVASVGHKTLCCIHAIRGVAYSLFYCNLIFTLFMLKRFQLSTLDSTTLLRLHTFASINSNGFSNRTKIFLRKRRFAQTLKCKPCNILLCFLQSFRQARSTLKNADMQTDTGHGRDSCNFQLGPCVFEFCTRLNSY